MKIYVAYGFATALGLALISLVLFYLGYHSDVTKMGAGQFIGCLASVLIAIACIAMGIKARRDQLPPNGNFSYKEALKTGVMISVFAGLFGSVTNYLYTHVINSSFNSLMIESQLLSAKQAGATEAQVAAARKSMEALMNPFIQSAMGIAVAIVGGTIISLLVAALLQRKVTVGRFGK